MIEPWEGKVKTGHTIGGFIVIIHFIYYVILVFELFFFLG